MRRLEATSQIGGRYLISGRIGSGGMGEVFRARDSDLGRTVALKMLPFELAIQRGFVERFRAEAQAAARISHPNVVQVYHSGQEGETNYIVMEYVRGKNLRQILAANQRLQPRQAAEVVRHVLKALEAAHDKGVIHRDVKPENILVSSEGSVKVTDFGIARALERAQLTAGMLGTVAYVAPEQARGEAVDPRTDLYSTGCMLYELVTGSLPFEGDAAKVLQDHLSKQVPAPSVLAPQAAPLDGVVRRATALRPQDRYPSAAAMLQDLQAAMASLPQAPALSALTAELTSEVPAESVDTVIRQVLPPGKLTGWRRWILAALAVLVLAGGLVALGPTRVPSIAGVSREVAGQRIRRAGLQARFKQVFSESSPGTVIGAKPSSGAWTRRGAGVAVTLSAGPRQSDVPPVVGLQLEQARRAIVAAGLTVGNIERRNDREPANRVLGQRPEPGRVRSGDPVSLVVSAGPAILEVPNLVGSLASEAAKILDGRGFGASLEPVFNPAAESTVVGQTPAAGQKLPQGTVIKLQVSRGPQPFQMPDVKGKACSETKAQLEALGMRVVAQSAGGAPGQCGANRVLEQDPLPQSSRRPGDEATLYVSG